MKKQSRPSTDHDKYIEFQRELTEASGGIFFESFYDWMEHFIKQQRLKKKKENQQDQQ